MPFSLRSLGLGRFTLQACERFTWPDFDRPSVFEFNRVVNEPDFLPLYFVRHLTQTATLLRRHKGHLKISPAGRRLIEASNVRALQAVLFHVAFWHFDLSVLGRGLHHGWLQQDAGIILWCLSVSANDWQSPTRLSRLCAIPINGVLDQKRCRLSTALKQCILRMSPNIYQHCNSRGRPTLSQPGVDLAVNRLTWTAAPGRILTGSFGEPNGDKQTIVPESWRRQVATQSRHPYDRAVR